MKPEFDRHNSHGTPTDAPIPRWLHTLRRARRFASRVVLVGVALLAGALGMRGWMTRNSPELEPWHTFVPQELDGRALDDADWPAYLAAENRAFEEVSEAMRAELSAEDRLPFNRYYENSLVAPTQFPVNWNRSYVLEPMGNATGVVVLLHGLSDSPYSLRHIAELYRARGYIAIALRLPGHGTVPAALSRTGWKDWMAAVRVAMREAFRRSNGDYPLHVVGYSNGGALAVKYALDALDDDALPLPDRIVLFSPMIGVTAHARFAGIAGWPAVLPAFAKSAWLDRAPEFNPFKYNSFPVHAARQSYLLTEALRTQLARLGQNARLERLPPLLTFQSNVDATVVASAVATSLYANLPANGSELVLFDINRSTDFGRFLRAGALKAPTDMLPSPPRAYRLTVITNASPRSDEVVAQSTAANTSDTTIEPIGLAYPRGIYSLSHIALPFPTSDGLYGLEPDPADQFGVRLGTLNWRGERGVLVAGLDTANLRITSNPFYPYVAKRIEALMDSRSPTAE